MTKPWEEAWDAEDHCDVDEFYGAGVQLVPWQLYLVDTEECHPFSQLKARARLASAAPDLVRVLLAVEWGCPGRYCLSCGETEPGIDAEGDRSGGHAPDCALDLALRKAGVR
jgi:hypothetical protein